MLNRIQIASKQYQNHVKITSTSSNDKTIDQTKLSRNSIFFETNPPEPPPKQNQKIKSNKSTSNIIKSSWQHRFDIVSKPYQNQIKIRSKPSSSRKLNENLSGGCFCFLSWNQHIGNPEKNMFPNYIKTRSKFTSQTIAEPKPKHTQTNSKT
jgi:hypothetical protein